MASPEGRCTFLNQRWCDFTGQDRSGDISSKWLEALHPEDSERVCHDWLTASQSGSEYKGRFRLRHSNGEYRWVSATATAELQGGQIVSWFGTCTDVHEQVHADEARAEAERKLATTLDMIPHVVWSAGPDGSPDFVNQYWFDTHGTEPHEATGTGWQDATHPDDREEAYRSWVSSVRTGKPHEAKFRMLAATGEYRWTHVRAVPERESTGEVVRWHGTCTDIHEQVVSEQALRESELLHRSILQASADCIKIISLDGTLELVNSPGACALELDGVEAVQGKKWQSLWPSAAQETVNRAIEEAASGKLSRFTGFRPAAKGTPKWWDVVVTPIIEDNGEVVRLLSVSRDITAERKTSEQLRWTSEHDALTTLPNRRTFQAHLQASIIKAMGTGGTVGLLLVDLDHFKHVNDTLGHAAGDHLLKVFGQRLKGCVRANDLVARLGGDEFAIILQGVEGEDDLMRAGESMLKRLTAPISYKGRALSAGASIGGAMFPQDASNAHDLFNNADTALYALKASGRGGTRMFHGHMRAEAQKVASQLSLARMAISRRTVVPHYQQKVDLQSGAVRGFEALLRWQHPTRGIQQPDLVAEAFKEYELASKIGELMQRKVFRDMANWLRQGVQFGCISINAAPAEFLRDDYAEQLLARLQARRLPPNLLEVEVTEHVFLERGSEYVSRALKLLHNAGVRISLDDFGTGYSSLSHLRDFPVDVVKIDRSFTARMVDQPEISAIVSAVIDLARSLSISVVAEGVETEEQEQALRAKGCTFGQGFLFGRAIEADEVPQIILGAMNGLPQWTENKSSMIW